MPRSANRLRMLQPVYLHALGCLPPGLQSTPECALVSVEGVLCPRLLVLAHIEPPSTTARPPFLNAALGASYSELNAVMTGAAPADVTRDGHAAHNTVPQFDPEIEAAAERRAGELRVHEVLGQEVAHLPDALGGMLQGHRNRTRQRQGTPTPDHTPSVMHRRGPLI